MVIVDFRLGGGRTVTALFLYPRSSLWDPQNRIPTPHELSFTKLVQPLDRAEYTNDCCIGGDKVAEALLPAVRRHYDEGLEAAQEDWGWFIWFDRGDVKLARRMGACKQGVQCRESRRRGGLCYWSGERQQRSVERGVHASVYSLCSDSSGHR